LQQEGQADEQVRGADQTRDRDHASGRRRPATDMRIVVATSSRAATSISTARERANIVDWLSTSMKGANVLSRSVTSSTPSRPWKNSTTAAESSASSSVMWKETGMSA